MISVSLTSVLLLVAFVLRFPCLKKAKTRKPTAMFQMTFNY